jgi:LTXXQ motif family protein
MRFTTFLVALAVYAMYPTTHAQRSDPRSIEGLLKSAPPKGDDARTVNANLPELVGIRLSQLEEDLNFTAAQMPLWKTYRSRVMEMLEDTKRGTRISASETTAPKRFDALADMARNRLTAVEDIVDAGKALYASLTPAQKEVADRRLALPLATLTGNDAGSDLRMQPRPAPK